MSSYHSVWFSDLKINLLTNHRKLTLQDNLKKREGNGEKAEVGESVGVKRWVKEAKRSRGPAGPRAGDWACGDWANEASSANFPSPCAPTFPGSIAACRRGRRRKGPRRRSLLRRGVADS